MNLIRFRFLWLWEVRLVVERVTAPARSARSSRQAAQQMETSIHSDFDYLAYEEKRREQARLGVKDTRTRLWITYRGASPVGITFCSPVEEKRLRIYCSKLLFRGVGLEYKHWCHNGEESGPGPKLFSKREYRALYKEMFRTGMAERVSENNRHRGGQLSAIGEDFCFQVVNAPSPFPEVSEMAYERKRIRQADSRQIGALA